MIKSKFIFLGLISILLLAGILLFSFDKSSTKIGGVNFVSPDLLHSFSGFSAMQRINANWIAFNPYAFTKTAEPHVIFNHKRSWWGEKTEGVIKMIQQAKQEHYKIMLKPHVWIMGQGWCGDFELPTAADWETWENDYEKYILTYAKIAEENKVELLCIGTEFKISVTKRSNFWVNLIKKVKTIYTGKLTYAANWDNYQNITFWHQLDYIGIDAYFPLSKEKTPSIPQLDSAWKKVNLSLQTFAHQNKKQIIFTEYGYKSTNYNTWNQWEIENIKHNEKVNISAQQIAYAALYKNTWSQKWFVGGFLWKWYPNDKNAGGLDNSDYTPQHKPVEKIIKSVY